MASFNNKFIIDTARSTTDTSSGSGVNDSSGTYAAGKRPFVIHETGNVSLGTTSSADTGVAPSKLTVNGAISISEISDSYAEPADDSPGGRIWVKDNNPTDLVYTNSNDLDIVISNVGDTEKIIFSHGLENIGHSVQMTSPFLGLSGSPSHSPIRAGEAEVPEWTGVAYPRTPDGSKQFLISVEVHIAYANYNLGTATTGGHAGESDESIQLKLYSTTTGDSTTGSGTNEARPFAGVISKELVGSTTVPIRYVSMWLPDFVHTPGAGESVTVVLSEDTGGYTTGATDNYSDLLADSGIGYVGGPHGRYLWAYTTKFLNAGLQGYIMLYSGAGGTLYPTDGSWFGKLTEQANWTPSSAGLHDLSHTLLRSYLKIQYIQGT